MIVIGKLTKSDANKGDENNQVPLSVSAANSFDSSQVSKEERTALISKEGVIKVAVIGLIATILVAVINLIGANFKAENTSLLTITDYQDAKINRAVDSLDHRESELYKMRASIQEKLRTEKESAKILQLQYTDKKIDQAINQTTVVKNELRMKSFLIKQNLKEKPANALVERDAINEKLHNNLETIESLNVEVKKLKFENLISEEFISIDKYKPSYRPMEYTISITRSSPVIVIKGKGKRVHTVRALGLDVITKTINLPVQFDDVIYRDANFYFDYGEVQNEISKLVKSTEGRQKQGETVDAESELDDIFRSIYTRKLESIEKDRWVAKKTESKTGKTENNNN